MTVMSDYAMLLNYAVDTVSAVAGHYDNKFPCHDDLVVVATVPRMHAL